MAHYAIGDVQGCYRELMMLLDKIAFNQTTDTLWFAGDIINGGHENLAVLRFLSQLPKKPVAILGNHDLHFLAVFHQIRPLRPADTFEDILNAPDAEILCHWLQSQSIAHYDTSFHALMVHAGISPVWSLEETINHAKEIEAQLQSNSPEQVRHFLKAIFKMAHGEQEEHWRLITDIFTRIRFCDQQGNLNFHYKGTIQDAPTGLYPWFQYNVIKNAKPIWDISATHPVNILFGHWAALEKPDVLKYPHLFALDTGCVWGGYLSALRLDDKQWFQVRGKKYR